ncbi:hypothetical protein MCUN1_000732 [Malassezia cuniculi]|uniref:HECT-type E3 ubiquitin transferase n=1 Tax=Malassezia cuniculi TaxID=948313 RepID=A0AAF0ENZ2_9BASI|nr:hypothetical protein MCUN1_000732 [Malassezia cuniculi]
MQLINRVLCSPASLAVLWQSGPDVLDNIMEGVPDVPIDEMISSVMSAKKQAQEKRPPHTLAGFATPALVPLAHWGAAAVHIASKLSDAAQLHRLAAALSFDEWRMAAQIGGVTALRAALAFKGAITSTDVAANKALFDAVAGYAASGGVPLHTLYVEDDATRAVAEYAAWVHGSTRVSICDYPFSLSMNAKASILAWEGYTAQRYAERAAWGTRCPSKIRAEEDMRVPGAGSSGGTLCIDVRREHVVADSMVLLSEKDLHIPLLVRFAGEDAQDIGGVRKEWLSILCEALEQSALFVDLGVTEPQMNGHLWFSGRDVDDGTAELFGIALGLALFYQVQVPLRVSPVLYKLLLWHAHGGTAPLGIDDLSLLKPALGKGVRHMLSYQGDSFEDTFQVTWSVSTPDGQVSLVPGGSERLVTAATCTAYAARLVHYELIDAPGAALNALYRGFARVVVPSSGRSQMDLLSADELAMLLCGREERLDINALRDAAVHVGFSARSPPRVLANVDDFWHIWASLERDDQHLLLAYITGSPRIPALGPRALGLRIHHVDGPILGQMDALPTSSTCTSTLFLPTYASREILEAKIRLALVHSRGFGLA